MGKVIVITNLKNRPFTFNIPGFRRAVHLNAARQDGDSTAPIELTAAGTGPEVEYHRRQRDIRVTEVG